MSISRNHLCLATIVKACDYMVCYTTVEWCNLPHPICAFLDKDFINPFKEIQADFT